MKISVNDRKKGIYGNYRRTSQTCPKLSKLSFSEEELADFTNQLDKIIDMVEL